MKAINLIARTTWLPLILLLFLLVVRFFYDWEEPLLQMQTGHAQLLN